jgi:hypothetical protein
LYIILKFNSPIPIDILKNCNITVRSYKFDNQIEISKISTIKEVRTKISQSLRIKENEFIMKKFSHMGQELKNNLDTIDKLTNSVLSIYIEYGNPLQDSKYFLNKIKSNLIPTSVNMIYCDSAYFLTKSQNYLH